MGKGHANLFYWICTKCGKWGHWSERDYEDNSGLNVFSARATFKCPDCGGYLLPRPETTLSDEDIEILPRPNWKYPNPD